MDTLDASATISSYKDTPCSVVRWRQGWATDRDEFGSLAAALQFAKEDETIPLKVEVVAHAADGDKVFGSAILAALYAAL